MFTLNFQAEIKILSIFQKLYTNYYNLKRCFKQSDYQSFQGFDPEDKQIIENYVNESLDVLQIYRDLILLKKAIMILLSKEQLAVLQLIGLFSDFLKLANKWEQSGEQKDQLKYKQITFFKEQYSILKQSGLREQHINQFFEKMSQGSGNLSLDDLQAQQNKTYLVFVTYFSFQNGTDYQLIPLNYTKCASSQLQGFNCFDFSTVKNKILTLIYEDADYNSVFSNPFAQFCLKLLTSQYNSTSQNRQVNKRNSFLYMQGYQFKYFELYIQKQITHVKQDAIIQYENSFNSPLQYDIQYATFTQVLSQCNSALALLMCLGFLGRKFALKLMREDIFLHLLQNIFHGAYQAILKKSNYLDEKNDICFENLKRLNDEKNERLEEKEEEVKSERSESVDIPSFLTKSIKSVDHQKQLLINRIDYGNQKQMCFRQSDYQSFQGLDPQDKQIIESYVNERLDFLQIYRDIILLKKAIMIFLSKEPLAALQLIGFSSDFFEQMSFFEEQYTILKQTDLQEQYINSVLQKMYNNHSITEVDQRILNSLL
ncbi:hypothetical protein ABPG72_000589 [Tetrahymena utriculariae]